MSNISDKDKKDWNTFLKSTEKIEDKDKTSYKDNKTTLSKSIDLHGYTLDEANRKVSELIHQSFLSQQLLKIFLLFAMETDLQQFRLLISYFS